MSKDTTPPNSYQGPGELTSALGTGDKWAYGGMVVGGIGSGLWANAKFSTEGKIIKGSAATAIRDMIQDGAFTGWAKDDVAKFMRNSPKVAKGAVVACVAVAGALVVGSIASSIGFFEGWGRAAKAKNDYNALAKENAYLKNGDTSWVAREQAKATALSSAQTRR